jgi:hypothetical protein
VHLFPNQRPGTLWLSLRRGGYGRGNLYFTGENAPRGAAIDFYLKAKPDEPVSIEISDATGSQKTVFEIKQAEAGINRLMWDMQFDPPASQLKQRLTQMQTMMEQILGRPEVEEEQKEVVEKALEELKQEGLSYRQAREIQVRAYEAIGFGGGMGFGGRGMAAPAAEPGTYVVKLTVKGKTYTGTIAVRPDPMLTGGV